MVPLRNPTLGWKNFRIMKRINWPEACYVKPGPVSADKSNLRIDVSKRALRLSGIGLD